jgi:hypothetical protein
MLKPVLIALPLLVAGCATTDRDMTLAVDTYSKADIDAINATAQCKALARTLLQVARCDVRR